MKNLLFLTSFFISLYSFSQNTLGEKKLKLEIRSTNSENEVFRKTNEHTSERINLKREDKKDLLLTPGTNRHNRPHFDKPSMDKSSKGESKENTLPIKGMSIIMINYNNVKNEKRAEIINWKSKYRYENTME